MRLAASLAAVALVAVTLTSCASTITQSGGATELADDAYAADSYVAGHLVAGLDTPAAAIEAVWLDPSTKFPYYAAQIVDPYNYPHLLWRAFYTIWTVPINPLYHVTAGPVEDWNANVSPIGTTVTYDFTPAPHGGDGLKYWASRHESMTRNIGNAFDTLKYAFLNTNSSLPPYDDWYPNQIQADKTTIMRTIDLHLFRYDWDDPYID